MDGRPSAAGAPPAGDARAVHRLLLAFFAFLSFAMAPANACLYLAALLLVPGLIRARRLPDARGAGLPFALLAAWAAVTLLWSPDPRTGLAGLKFFLPFVAFLALLEAGRGRPAPGRVFALLLAMNAAFLYAAPLIERGGYRIPVFRRLGSYAAQYTGPFTLSIAYGEFLSTLLLASLPWVIERAPRPAARGLLLGFSACCGVALLLTGSRSAWLGFAAGLALLAFRRFGRRGRLAVGVAGLLFAALLALPATRTLPVLNLVSERIAATAAGHSTGREAIYRVGLSLVAERPLLGHGAGAVGALYAGRVSSLPGIPEERRDYRYAHLHSNYLQILAEWGGVGLALFLWLLVALARALLRPGGDPALREGALACLAAHAVSGLFEFNFFYSNVSRLFFALTALALADDGAVASGSGTSKASGE